MIQSGITQGTPSKVSFGAGVYFKGVTFDEKIAPTEEAVKAAIIGATQEGGTVTITPEFFDIPADGALVPVAELKQKVGETAQMEVSFLELTADLIQHQVVGKLSETTDKEFDVITSDDHLRASHFYEGFGYWGHHIDGREIIVIFKKALCTSGHVSEHKNKTNTVFKGTFECHSDIEFGTNKLPYAIFIRKAEGWEPVNAEEVAAA
jgi:hypothetical protein